MSFRAKNYVLVSAHNSHLTYDLSLLDVTINNLYILKNNVLHILLKTKILNGKIIKKETIDFI